MGRARFELAFDPDEALRVLKKHKDLVRLMGKVGPFALVPAPSPTPFEALAHSITFQQLNGKAAATIFERFRNLFPRPMKPDHILAASDEALRGAGLSRAKALAIRDLAEKASQGLIPSWTRLRKLEDEEILRRFTQVRGIGRWTVEMLLIFRLGRPDVWPVDDYAVRRAYGLAFGIETPDPKEMAGRAEAWRPFRTVVAWYLWWSLES